MPISIQRTAAQHEGRQSSGAEALEKGNSRRIHALWKCSISQVEFNDVLRLPCGPSMVRQETMSCALNQTSRTRRYMRLRYAHKKGEFTSCRYTSGLHVVSIFQILAVCRSFCCKDASSAPSRPMDSYTRLHFSLFACSHVVSQHLRNRTIHTPNWAEQNKPSATLAMHLQYEHRLRGRHAAAAPHS